MSNSTRMEPKSQQDQYSAPGQVPYNTGNNKGRFDMQFDMLSKFCFVDVLLQQLQQL